MDDVAFLFPGQGSQSLGMGKWLDGLPEAATVYDQAESAGFDVRRIVSEGPAEALDQTETTQPAILTVSVATLEAFRSMGVAPSAVAGHSLGEYSALVAAGVLSFGAALELVLRRGELMASAGKGRAAGMLAMIGIETDILEAICEEASHEDEIVTIANYNCPGQIVISGDLEALDRASDMARAAGAKRIMPLRVSSAFHSPLMEDAAVDMAELLSAADLAPPLLPIYCNVSARAETDSAIIRSLLTQQMTSPVRWEHTLRQMASDGIRRFVEVGPGTVLAGLARRTLSGSRTLTSQSREEFEETARVLAEG